MVKKKVDPFVFDEDDGPFTDEEWANTEVYRGKEVFEKLGWPEPPKPRGRPLSDAPKKQVTVRLDADILAALRASGKGWQTRVNAALREKFVDNSSV